MSVNVVAYQKEWESLYSDEEKVLYRLLDVLCIKLYHVGSTSVPGLVAKPVIDILCVVSDLEKSKELLLPFYIFKGEYNVPMRFFFSKYENIKIHLHMVTLKSIGFIEMNLLFRNYLCIHSNTVSEYAELKQQLVKCADSGMKTNSFTNYTLKKDAFIKKVLNEAGFSCRCVNFCCHDAEWRAYEQVFEHRIGNCFVLYTGTRITSLANLKNGVLRMSSQNDFSNFISVIGLQCLD